MFEFGFFKVRKVRSLNGSKFRKFRLSSTLPNSNQIIYFFKNLNLLLNFMSQAIPRKNVVKNIDSDFMPSKIMNADDVAFLIRREASANSSSYFFFLLLLTHQK